MMMISLKVTGVTDELTIESIRTYLLAAGPLAILGYIVAFAVSNLLSVPGVIFISAAILVYGVGLGTVVAIVGALCSVVLNFVVVRKIGGTPLGDLKGAWARRALRYLDDYPIRTIFILRSLMLLNPHLNYTLALSSVKFRDYLIGSALGLIIPIGINALGLDYLFPQYTQAP